jgi:uncharacterized protein (DUF1684 family)
MTKSTILALVAWSLALAQVNAPATAETEFRKTERLWREGRAKRITSPTGWLTVVGLSWLSPGENTFGSDPECAVPLPEGKAPRHAGVLVLAGDKVTIKAAPDSGVTLDGKPVGERVLGDDMSGTTDIVNIGELSFYVIRRGEKLGVRVKDPNSPARTNFKGLDYFPMEEKWRVTGTFVPYGAPRKVDIPTVLGTVDVMESPGVVKFKVDGRELTLEPVVEDPKDPSLWFIFKDGTSAKETYGAGRFLYSDMPKDGKVVVDFNQAYNPPCAFTPYATCPLPPKQNWLPVRVDAGEKAYTGGHGAR